MCFVYVASACACFHVQLLACYYYCGLIQMNILFIQVTTYFLDPKITIFSDTVQVA